VSFPFCCGKSKEITGSKTFERTSHSSLDDSKLYPVWCCCYNEKRCYQNEKGTLENAYERLRELAIESGASQDIELIQMREKDRTIMFGLPGTLKNVQNGSFPPLEDDDDDEDAE
jgi:hypothetical protein